MDVRENLQDLVTRVFVTVHRVYQQRTSRGIPVVELRPADDDT